MEAKGGKKKGQTIQEHRQNTDQEQTASKPTETAKHKAKGFSLWEKTYSLLTCLYISLYSFQGSTNFPDCSRLEAYPRRTVSQRHNDNQVLRVKATTDQEMSQEVTLTAQHTCSAIDCQ